MNAKRITKRVIAVILTMMLALSCFVLPGALSASAAGETIVKIHYLRSDGDYSKSDVYTWGDGDAKTFTFADAGDDAGAVAEIPISQSIASLGFIIRQEAGNWDTKDPDGDRSVDLRAVVSGTVHVYCVSGSALDDYRVDYSETVQGLKIKSANAESRTKINFVLTMQPEDAVTVDDFTVTSASGATVAVSDVVLEGDSGSLLLGDSGTLLLAEELDYLKSYTVAFRDTFVALKLPDYFSSAEFEDAYTYTGDDLGVTFVGGGTNFRVWAPTAESVKLNIYAAGDGGTAESVIPMQAAENGTWVAAADGNLSGKYYTYTAAFDGFVNEDIVDPYARSVGVNGKRGMILDLDSTDPDGWDSDSRHTYANLNEMEIYEVHVRDFSIDSPFDYDNGIQNKGKYLAFTERGTQTPDGVKTGVDHLVDLGVTSVHILPSYDYGSVDETKLDKAQYNFGYDPVNYNAPEGSYSTDPYHGEVRVNEYKQMVKGLHDAGLGVIMDVVYNHTYNTNYCFEKLVPGYFYRPDQNTSGCGNDVASERSMVSKFIVDSVAYWASEYHLDGFRFDLMGILDVDTMNAVRAALDKIDPSIIVYGEGWDMGSVPTKNVKMANYTNAALTPGIAYFSDTIRDALKGSVFEAKDKGFINGNTKNYKALAKSIIPYTKKWSPSPSQIIHYVDCHDNLTLWDKIRSSNPADSEEDQIRQNLLAAASIQTSLGIPFMMSGEEFLRTKTKADGTFEHNSYASPDSVNALDYSRVAAYADVYNYYKGLIQFRKAHPVFTVNTTADADSAYATYIDNTEAGVVAYTLKGGINGEKAENIIVILNPLSDPTQVTLPEGDWDIYVEDQTAGTSVLATVSGSVLVPRISAMVLVQGYEAPEAASRYSIIGTMTDWTDDIPMYDMGDGKFAGKFTVGAGVHQFKVRADGDWKSSWGPYDEENDSTMNIPDNNCKIETTAEKTTVSVILDTNGEEELWSVSYMYPAAGDDAAEPSMVYVNTGKPSQQSSEPSSEQPSKDEPSKTEPSKTEPSVSTPVESSTPASQQPSGSVDPGVSTPVTGSETTAIPFVLLVLAAGAAVVVAITARKSKASR